MTKGLMARARFWLVLALLGLGGAAATAEPAPPLGEKEVERIVRDYLMREPEVIYDALQELQRRQAAEAAERQRVAVRDHQDALLADAAAPVGGNPEGDVTLVEFFDYRCTYCRRVVDALQELLEEDPDLRVVFKELPVLGEDSVRAARAALAAEQQDGYLPFHFALMRATDLSEAGIVALAKRQGLDPERLLEDMYTDEVDRAIEANYRLADALGIEGTPAFVIGDQLVPGAIDKARMQALIQDARSS